MVLGSLLRAWRDEQRLGTRAVAKEIGISKATLSRFERGYEIDGRTFSRILVWAFGASKLEIGNAK